MKTLKVLLLAMLFMAIALPANAIEVGPYLEVTKTVDPVVSKAYDEVLYEICIINHEESPLIIETVDDTLLGTLIPPPGIILEPNDVFCETFPYTIQPEDPDPLVNEVTVKGNGPCCDFEVTATAVVDLVHPDFVVEMDCPSISKVGDEMCYTIIITNTGDTPLMILNVEDNVGSLLAGCVGVILGPGEQCNDECCFVVLPKAPDPIENIVTVMAEVVGLPNILERESEPCVTDLVHPSIEITKTVDPCEACPGETVIYTICIENTGDWDLENVVVMDPDYNALFPSTLSPGEIWCEAYQYRVKEDDPCPLLNYAEVTANPVDLPNVIDANDCATICCPSPPGEEGCTPGFWKNNGDKHSASAWCDPFSPSMRISDVFILNVPLIIRGNGKSTITDPTLLQALGANGGGVNAMIRHGVAALLNACSDCVNYPIIDPFEVILMIEDTLNEVPGVCTVDELHSMFATYNEYGCPLNQHGECVGGDD